MEDRLADWGNRSLRQMVLPASHDAGMYLVGFPQSLGRTQTLNLYGQLKLGVRYFDLRPSWRDGTLYIHHDIITGPRLCDVLNDVRRFMNEGHRELIILKLSHYDSFNADRYESAIAEIQNRLGSWLYVSKPAGKRLADIPLKVYLQSTGRVLVVCDGSYPVQHHHDGIWVYRDCGSLNSAEGDFRVYDQFSNTISYSVMSQDQFAKFDRYDGICQTQPRLKCDLFLLSWTLTPLTDVPAFAALPNQKLSQAISQMKFPNSHGFIPNLLYVDCVETADLAKISIAMNAASTLR